MDALLVGLGETNVAVARALLDHGDSVVVVDDRPSDASRAAAEAMRVRLVETPDDLLLRTLVANADVVIPSPGVRYDHPARYQASTHDVPVWSEFELAARWGIGAEVIAVTGTNGKTTVTTLVTAMLKAAGARVVAAGNNQPVALVEARTTDAEVIVVEAPSFRLADIEQFNPGVAVWLNLTEDHLDWHPTMRHYVESKANIWRNHDETHLAIVNAEDPVVMEAVAGAASKVITFGIEAGDWHVSRGSLRAPDGTGFLAVDALPRAFPHDLSNNLAATAAATAVGVDIATAASVLETFKTLPHRIELVGDAGGVRYYDDSKATTPASVVAAVNAFDSVVLIAGGRNAGMDLGVLRSVADRIRAVVAIGEAADEIAEVFSGVRPVVKATSMDEAVAEASTVAKPGDAVLLSPACKSHDWYRSYAERGADYTRAVNELLGTS